MKHAVSSLMLFLLMTACSSAPERARPEISPPPRSRPAPVVQPPERQPVVLDRSGMLMIVVPKEIVDIYGTPAHSRDEEAQAKLRSYLASVKELSSGGSVSYTLVSYEQALRYAVERGERDEIRTLLDAGADPNARDHGGFTLLTAVLYGKYDFDAKVGILELLLKRGLDPNLRYGHENSSHILVDIARNSVPTAADIKSTSLTKYTEDEAIALTRLLLKYGAQADVVDGLGNTAFVDAVARGLNRLAEVIYKQGIEVDHAVGPDGGGAITHLLRDFAWDAFDHQRIVSAVAFLVRHGADVNRRNLLGETPLHTVATYCEQQPSAEELAAFAALAGKKPDKAADSSASAGAGTADTGAWRDDLLRLMIANGAEVNAGDEAGATPMMHAKTNKCKQNVAYLESIGGTLTNGAFPMDNSAPAAKAVLTKDLATIASLSAADLMKISARSSFGVPTTPLHLAAESGDRTLLEVLDKKGVDWNSPDQYKRTPLRIAVDRGDAETAAFLLKAGADANQRDAYSLSSYDVAFASRKEIFRLFRSKDIEPAGGLLYRLAALGDRELLWNVYERLSPEVKKNFDNDRLAGEAAFGGHAELAEEIIRRSAPSLSAKERSKITKDGSEALKKIEDHAAHVRSLKPPVRVSGGIGKKRGTFRYTVESWDPQEGPAKDRDLKDYPVDIYVPASYTGKEPYGLMVFMHGRRKTDSYPSKAYRKMLDERKIIWVGYSSYNGLYEPFQPNHERFNLAVLYQMKRYFNIDTQRVYLAGLSWGGLLTCEIMCRQSDIFTGAIAMGGCDNLSSPLSRKRGDEGARLVFSAGDFDYNRRKVFSGYTFLSANGFRAYYLQDPDKGHTYLSSGLFEKAMGLIDDGRESSGGVR